MKSMIKLEATTKIELVYTVLQFAGRSSVLSALILTLIDFIDLSRTLHIS
jgi:hypothetical protein